MVTPTGPGKVVIAWEPAVTQHIQNKTTSGLGAPGEMFERTNL